MLFGSTLGFRNVGVLPFLEFVKLAIICVFTYWVFNVVCCKSQKKYLVSTPGCKIPDISPWDSSIVKFFAEKVKPVVCSKRRPLTYVSERGGRQHLYVDLTVLRLYAPSLRHIACCYSVIERLTDSTNKPGLCVAFKANATLGRKVEHVYVKCVDHADRTQRYANVHAVVQTPIEGVSDKKMLSVVMLGIDTMSRLNFERTMPRTAKFLKSTGWLEMRGYNKMGRSTLPNLMAILTGDNQTHNRNVGCLLPTSTIRGYDHCPFVWKKFKRKGYITAYNEDENYWSLFNYKSVGLRQKPTDFYFHPLMVEAFAKLKWKTTFGFTVCVGQTSVTDLILQNTFDLMKTFKHNLFALSWLNNFSHENYRFPATMDGKILEFFRSITKSEALENTIFVFLSDHGFRTGPIRQTHVGWLEESLPFLYFHLPSQFLSNYKEASSNLASNANKLTSPFDLHLTLMEVLNGVGAPEPRMGSRGCFKCQSLFSVVDENRTCHDAGIPTEWCMCVKS